MQLKPHSELKIRALLKEGEYILAGGPHPEQAALDAEMLLLHILRRRDPERSRAWLVAHRNSPVMPSIQQEHEALVARRLTGEPLQYILSEAEFYGLPFSVSPGVLIPRPETEHLVEEVLSLADKIPAQTLRIADIGTGSGIIAVALAHALPQVQIDAVDLSPQALHVARNNAQRNNVSDRIRFHEGDLLTPLAGRRFHIVASNPPYIPTTDHGSLAIEVRDHEPHTALFAGEDGLDIYRRLIPAALNHLEPGGWLVMEIGFGQQEPISALLAQHGYLQIAFRADYQQIPRVAIAMRP